MSGHPIQLTRKLPGSGERARLVRLAKILAWLGVGWHRIEAAVAVGAGLAAGSIALSFYVIAAYVGFEALRTLLAGDHPEAS